MIIIGLTDNAFCFPEGMLQDSRYVFYRTQIRCIYNIFMEGPINRVLGSQSPLYKHLWYSELNEVKDQLFLDNPKKKWFNPKIKIPNPKKETLDALLKCYEEGPVFGTNILSLTFRIFSNP